MPSNKMKRIMEARRKSLAAKSGGKIPYFLIKEGTMRVRLVPVGDETEIAQEATFFYVNKEIGGIVSPMTFGEPCALTEAYEKLKKSKNDDDREMAEKIKPKKRYFALCYRYKDEKGTQVDTEGGVQLVILTNSLYQDLIDLYLDEEQGDMTDPIKGYDVKFKRTGTGQFDTEYSVTPCKPSKMSLKYKGKSYDPIQSLKDIISSYEDTEDIVEKVIGVSVAPKKKKKFGSSSTGIKKKKKLKSRF